MRRKHNKLHKDGDWGGVCVQAAADEGNMTSGIQFLKGFALLLTECKLLTDAVCVIFGSRSFFL